MNINELDVHEQNIIKGCIEIVFNDSVMLHSFHARMGIRIDDARFIMNKWPDIDCTVMSSYELISGSLIEVWGGLVLSNDYVLQKTGLSRMEIEIFYERWQSLAGYPEGSIFP
jgi:hypothetical protein